MSLPTTRKRIGPAASLVLVLLMACGGGGGGGGGIGDLLAGGGIGGTGITIGAISGFGSVIVNDVVYDTENAKVFVNGNYMGKGDSVVRSKLGTGMVIRIEGKHYSDGTSKAEQIVFTSNLKGTVQSITVIDSTVKILSILGQSVILDDQTNIKNKANIAVKNVLEVSGWPDAGGQIQASYVRKVSDIPDPNTEQVIKGMVTNSSEIERQFHINQLMVDMSVIFDPVPAVGQLVIVYGDLVEINNLVASKLEIEDELGVEDADNVEIEGIVTQAPVLPSVDYDFILGSTKVKTDKATNFVGLTIDDIMPGARLLVEGALSQGVLLADEIKAKDKVDIEGRVATVDTDQKEITLRGLSPLVVGINSATRIFGREKELSEIEADLHDVKILGYAAGIDYVVAAQVKVSEVKKNKPSEVKLQGPIIYIKDPIVSIFEVDIDTAQIPDDGFYTAEEGHVSRNDFLDQATEGDTVNAMGNLDGDSVKWKEIELILE